jgi:hypothetical protein
VVNAHNTWQTEELYVYNTSTIKGIKEAFIKSSGCNDTIRLFSLQGDGQELLPEWVLKDCVKNKCKIVAFYGGLPELLRLGVMSSDWAVLTADDNTDGKSSVEACDLTSASEESSYASGRIGPHSKSSATSYFSRTSKQDTRGRLDTESFVDIVDLMNKDDTESPLGSFHEALVEPESELPKMAMMEMEAASPPPSRYNDTVMTVS